MSAFTLHPNANEKAPGCPSFLVFLAYKTDWKGFNKYLLNEGMKKGGKERAKVGMQRVQ
jgi:hypothetical protein